MYSEQNLMAFCKENEIYFATIKTIEPRTELKVWYAKSYAEAISERILEITPEEQARYRKLLLLYQEFVYWLISDTSITHTDS